MMGTSQRWVGAVAIACLGMATVWLQPDYVMMIMGIGSFFILLVVGMD